MKDYLAALADFLQERPREGTDKTDKTPPEGSSVSFVSTPPRPFQKTPWPYATAADEPRCPSCRHWWPIPGEVWHPTGEAVGDCQRFGFETLEKDNCFGHEPQQGSALRNEP
jgi:hypothetical protein